MIVYYSDATDSISIESIRQLFPAQSLAASYSIVDETVEIWISVSNRRIVGPVHFSDILDEHGNGFSDVMTTYGYLAAEFAKKDTSAPLATANW